MRGKGSSFLLIRKGPGEKSKRCIPSINLTTRKRKERPELKKLIRQKMNGRCWELQT